MKLNKAVLIVYKYISLPLCIFYSYIYIANFFLEAQGSLHKQSTHFVLMKQAPQMEQKLSSDLKSSFLSSASHMPN